MPRVDTHADLLLCDLAVERGLATPEDVAEVLLRGWRREDGAPSRLAEDLVLIADLAPAELARLRAEVGRLAQSAGGSAKSAVSARSGIDYGIHAALSRQGGATSRALTKAGAPPRVPLAEMHTGRYLNFMPIGEGGMGLVYLALDTELNREVAIKLIRPKEEQGPEASTDDPLSLNPPEADSPLASYFQGQSARFLQEAWITGGLEHPGIVPIYELGRTPSGVPYYTMRFVRGSRTLRDAIDEAAGGGLEARLKLLEPFLRVCDAIAYANARGVLHRDLKPANVALGEYGEVVVLDWGLAGVSRPGEDDTGWHERLEAFREAEDLETVEGALGTPGYMAPEAALGDFAAMGPRSDVYGLGVILFELLAGRRPFAFTTFLEYATKVATKDPPPLATVRDDVPQRLADLCRSAIARRPEERPADAAALAQGIRDWQAQSQVEREIQGWLREAQTALEESRSLPADAGIVRLDAVLAACAMVERARPGQTEATALVQTATAAREALLIARVQQDRKRVLRRVAVAAIVVAGITAIAFAGVLGQKNDALETANHDEERARHEAEGERDSAEVVVGYLLDDLREGFERIGRLDLSQRAVELAYNYYEQRAHTEGVALEGEALRRSAVALTTLASIQMARGDLPAGAKAAADAFERAARFAGLTAEDEAWTQEMLVAGRLRAALARAAQDTDEAELWFGRVISRLEGRIARAPVGKRWHLVTQLTTYQRHRGRFRAEVEGRAEDAERDARAALKLLDPVRAGDRQTTVDRFELAMSLELLGELLHGRGDMTEADSVLSEGFALARVLAREDPRPALLRTVSRLGRDRAEAARLEGRTDAALGILGEALSASDTLVSRDGDNGPWRRERASVHHGLSTAYQSAGKLDSARRHALAALSDRQELIRRDPENPEWRGALSVSHARLAQVLAVGEDWREAEAQFRTALGIRQKLLDAHPDHVRYRRDVAGMHAGLATLLSRRGGDLKAAYREAVAAAEGMKVLAEGPSASLAARGEYANALQILGDIALRGRDYDGARRANEEAVSVTAEVASKEPTSRRWAMASAGAVYVLAQTEARSGAYVEADRNYARAIAMFRALDPLPNRVAMQLRGAIREHRKFRLAGGLEQPVSPADWRVRAVLLSQVGQHQKAFAAYEQVFALHDPGQIAVLHVVSAANSAELAAPSEERSDRRDKVWAWIKAWTDTRRRYLAGTDLDDPRRAGWIGALQEVRKSPSLAPYQARADFEVVVSPGK